LVLFQPEDPWMHILMAIEPMSKLEPQSNLLR
jgi:hypothetical protein